MNHDSNFQSKVIVSNELEKRIVEAFETFDHTGSKTIDVREIAPVLCSLGCVPTKAEIEEIVQSLQEQENPDSIHLSKLLPLISDLISKYKFHPASAEELLKAFHVLDKDNVGYLNVDYISKLMTEFGESFSQDELNNMLTVATDAKTGTIHYETYINHIMID